MPFDPETHALLHAVAEGRIADPDRCLKIIAQAAAETSRRIAEIRTSRGAGVAFLGRADDSQSHPAES